MTTIKKIAYLVSGLLLLCGLAVVLSPFGSTQERAAKPEQDQKTMKLIPSLDGSDLFHAYCATCHGTDGKGHGPVAAALNTSVPDLTTIAKRHGGIFPSKRIERIIAGDELISAHGSRDMPIWGPIFHQIEEDRDFGDIRLHNVTRYIEIIQQK